MSTTEASPPVRLGPLQLVGFLSRFRRSGPEALRELIAERGDRIAVRVGPWDLLLLSDPLALEPVVVDRAGAWARPAQEQRIFRRFLGRGLLSSAGEAWQAGRRAVQPAFLPPALALRLPGLARRALALRERWTERARRGEPVEPAAELSDFMLAATLEAVLGVEADARALADWHELLYVLDQEHHRLGSLALPGWVPTPGERRFRRTLADVDRRLHERIAAGPAAAPPGTLLAALAAHEPDPARARDQLLTCLFAGHDTTASALAWLLLRLAREPEEAARLREEARGALDGLLAGELPRPTRLGAAFQEALRLYPPVWVLGREATQPDQDGLPVRAGTVVIYSPYALGRHPALWPDPLAFRPERFLPGAPPRPRCAFLPFGGGPRVCPGAPLATLAAQAILAALLPAFQLRALDPDPLPGSGTCMLPRGRRLALEPCG